ncbi:MAG: hypothetical protein J6E40_04225 [Lachnospiraceae bacterium]|nr:hypothetical protein [Lachnospiraceae bacterium]
MVKNKIFLWVQTALCVLIAVLLASSAVRIFIDGSAYQAAGHPSEWIYTREKVTAALMPILPLFLLSFAMTVYSLVKDIKDEEADKPVQDVERARDLVCARVAQPSEEMAKERALQKKLQLGGWIGFAVCMIPILLYITNGAHFALTDAEGLDHSIVSMIAYVVPWTVLGLACLIVTTVLQGKSMQREADAATALMKGAAAAKAAKAPSAGAETVKAASAAAAKTAEAPSVAAESAKAPNASKAAAPLYNTSPETARRRVIIRRVLLVAAVIFVVLGVQNGSMKDVLVKAIRICTECVGLG